MYHALKTHDSLTYVSDYHNLCKINEKQNPPFASHGSVKFSDYQHLKVTLSRAFSYLCYIHHIKNGVVGEFQRNYCNLSAKLLSSLY